MVKPVLPMLALILGTLSTPAVAQMRVVVDGQVREIPDNLVRAILAAAASGQAPAPAAAGIQPGQFIPGAVTVTTVETTEEDENGNPVQTSYETHVEPVAAVAFAPPIQQALYMPQTWAPTFTPSAPAMAALPNPVPAPAAMPHLDVDLAALMMPDLQLDSGRNSTLRIARDSQTGHFIAPIRINGVEVRAIIDTGAQETILSARDARLTGANHDIVSSESMAGIGGYTTLNVTRVRSMEVAGQQLGGFNAAIGQDGIPFTLLGQTEIARLGRIEIENGVMTITPRGSMLAMR